MGERNDLGIITNVVAVILAMFAAYAFLEYGAGRDPMGCNYPGTPAHTAGERPSIPIVTAEGAYKAPDCREPKNEKEDDLCQQMRMASSAEESACVGRRQFWLSVFGLGGLVATVFYAASAVRVASDTAKRQLRAYVNVSKSQITKLEHGAAAEAGVVIKNSGLTPASDLTVWYNIGCRPYPFPANSFYKPDNLSNRESATTLGNGDTLSFNPKTKGVIGDQIDLYRRGVLAVVVYGEVAYKDIYGRRQTTGFRMFNTSTNGQFLRKHGEGNEAT